jgi:hypothetical protein
LHRPFSRVHNWVAEHVEEDGLGEGVELGKGSAALCPQRARLVQDIRDSPLLGERWEKKSLPICIFSVEPWDGGSSVEPVQTERI